MQPFEPYITLGLALAAGLLIGLEREQSAPISAPSGTRHFLGGARTVPLVSLLGAISALLARESGPWVLALGFAPVLCFVVIAYVKDVMVNGRTGMTNEVVFPVTFFIGVLSASSVFGSLEQRVFVVSALAVVCTLLLSSKPLLHGLVQRTSPEDVFATVKFLIVAVVVLPLLPDRTFGPLEVINPFKVGLMVVLIAGISFCGYLAIRALGAGRGLTVTAALGGLVSSTAVMLSFAGRARKEPAISRALSAGVVLSSSIMFARVLLEVTVVNFALVPTLAAPTITMFATGLLTSWILYRRAARAPTDGVQLTNPFELSTAVKFGLLFAGVLWVSKAATLFLGTGGTYAAGVLSGLTDVDAITLSMAELSKSQLAPRVAVTTILLATASNTLVKAGMAIAVGGWEFGRRVTLSLLAVLTAGGMALGVVWVLEL